MDDIADGEIGTLPAEAVAEVAALAKRLQNANGPLMRVLNRIGAKVESGADILPAGIRDGLAGVAVTLLEQAYAGAARIGSARFVPRTDPRVHRLAAVASGAMGGAGGIASALVELPATVGLIFGAMQKVAAQEGFEPTSDEVRLTCLEILGSGGPGTADDGIDTTFFGARLGLSGSSINAVIARVAPRFATLLGQKLASQAVPLIGAAAGAGVNYLFLRHFEDLARVRFGLKRLALQHGDQAVLTAFRAETARQVAQAAPAS